MPDADAVHQGRAGDTGIIVEFIHHTRISDKRTATGDGGCYFVGYQTTKVTGMIMQGDTTVCVLNHQVVDFIDTTFEGLYQSTPSDDGIKRHWDIGLAQLVND